MQPNLESVGVSVIFLDTNMSQAAICNSITSDAFKLRYRNTTTLMSVTTRVSLSDCFERVASVKTLEMYKRLLENSMQMKN